MTVRCAPTEAAANRPELAGRVTFAGFQRDPGEWYPAMDAFVLPSITEGTPLALLEAMAHGIPVVASAVGGVPAVVTHGHSALLVPAADAAALADAMSSLAASAELRGRLATEARLVVEQQYNVTQWIRHIVDVYRSSLERRSREAAVATP